MGTADMRSLKTVAMVAAVLAATAFAATAEAAGGKHSRAADLAIRAVDVDPPRFFFSDEPWAQIMVTVRVENGGEAPASRSSGVVRLRNVSGSDGGPPIAAKFRIPEMKPGRASTPSAFIEVSRLSGLGIYAVEGCVDRKVQAGKKRAKLACKQGQEISVVPRAWEGEVRGSAEPIPGVTESWVADVGFVYEPVDRRSANAFDDGFTYSPTGWIEFRTKGKDGAGCTHSGFGAYQFDGDDGALFVSRDLTTYRGIGSIVVPDAWRYIIGVNCGILSQRRFGPDTSAWLETGDRGTAPVATRLEGARTDSERPIEWDWTLKSR